MSKITRCKVRMYRAGTGDCFLIKFYAGRARKFTMMIDGGVWQGSKDYLEHFAKHIDEACDGKLDLLIITHEHKDHVLMFDRCKDIFNKFEIKDLWLAWTENDADREVKRWKKKYGEKKKALTLASDTLDLAIKDNSVYNSMAGHFNANEMMDAQINFSNVLTGFSDLHASADEPEKIYKGALKGMQVIKEQLNVENVKYCKQGEIIQNLSNLDGINFYILGPPNLYESVKVEKGEDGESYDHNKDIEDHELFSAAVQKDIDSPLKDDVLPFDRNFILEDEQLQKEAINIPNTEVSYNDPLTEWRKIDHDWLFSAGNLALRMNSLTNNLSLAVAIEFEESKKVMLFPGDAEFGSWESWHQINWARQGTDGKHLTEDLLNRTVFYKVAHHLSHNGTAQSLGLEMMTHPDLAAMATLDFSNISSGWKSTMPNRAILKELLQRTKGRLILINEDGIYYDFNEQVEIKEKIKDARKAMNASEKTDFENDFDIPEPKEITYTKSGQEVTEEKILFYEYSVDGK